MFVRLPGILRIPAVLVFFGLAFPLLVTPQGFGTIVGTVTDPTTALVPRAKVTATNMATQLSRDVTTNEQGYFVIPSLPPATYRVAVDAPGFSQFTQENVTLLADQSLTLNVTVSVQQTASQVTVEATPIQVDTTTSTLNQVVEQKRIVDLPLNGRNAASLTLLVPGAVQANSAGSDQGQYKTFPSAVTASINGSRANQTSFNMDGSANNDTYTNVNQPFPFPDALQEFSVQTSNYSARYGGNAGGVVNIITKSGSNELHGDAFEFVRNAVFNARNFFASQRDQLKRNQYGVTVGGPVVLPHLYDGRNKTFFFFGYQGTQIRNISSSTTATVPTPANLNGDFSAYLNAASPSNPFGSAVSILDPLTNTPFPNNRIPVNRFDPAALAFTRYLPVNQAAPNGRVFYGLPQSQGYGEYLARGDHAISEKDRLVARYYLAQFKNDAFLTPTNYLAQVSASAINSHNALLGETHVFKPNLLNDLRLSFSRVVSDAGPPPSSINVADLGVRNIYQPPVKTLDGLSVSGYFNLSLFPPSFFGRNNYTVTDDVTWVAGRHSLSFGGSFGRGQVILRNGFLASGSFGFTNDYTNNALASFLLGKMRTFQQGAGEFKDNRDKYVGLYIQDDFHASQRLTLNFGVRYEPFFPWQEIRGRVEQFRLDNYYAGTRSQVYPNAPAGLLFPGDPGMPVYGVNNNYRNIAPRVGFAYALTSDGKTSIRGAAGMFYDSQQIGIINNRFVDVAPFSPQVSITGPSGPFSNPYNVGNPGQVPSPFPATFPPPKNSTFPTPVLAVTYDPANNSKMATPVAYNWNLTLERQFGSWLARAAYVGSMGRHITETIELNPSRYIPGSSLSTDQRRLFQPYASIGQNSQDVNSNFNSMQLSVQRRMTNGFTILANYTWAKSLDSGPLGQGQAGIASQNVSPIPWYMAGRHQFDYGRSEFDRRHRAVVSYVWESPALANRSGLLRQTLGSWEVTGIVTLQSGGPLTILAGRDISSTGLNGDRAVLTGVNVIGPGACRTAPCVDYLNTTAFALPAAGTFGNVGKGSFDGPGLFNWDMGALKRFALGSERFRLEFHAEFFNVFNRVNLANPNQTFTAAGFGTITGTATEPRIGQLALKFLF